MKPIYEMYICNIDITNHCPTGCIYCSRFIRHLRPDHRYHMSLEDFRKALESLVDWPGQIGIGGGEPTLHPQFKEICDIIHKFPRPVGRQYQLFTSCGPRYQEMKDVAVGTFCCIHENPHDEGQRDICLHQPSLVAIGEAVKSSRLREQLIDDCWVQATWAPCINSKGAFFCEVAGGMDTVLDGPGGYPVEPGWWKKEPKDFQDQRKRYCHKCGMAVPLNRQVLKNGKEKITPRLLKEFEAHNLSRTGQNDMEIVAGTLTVKDLEESAKTWDPGNYRQDLRKDKWER